VFAEKVLEFRSGGEFDIFDLAGEFFGGAAGGAADQDIAYAGGGGVADGDYFI